MNSSICWTNCWQCWCWKLAGASLLAMGGAIAYLADCARAQITPDGTLGAESSVVTPSVVINALPSDRIDGGAIRGANLFHSFREFNVDRGLGAYFTNPVGIENILSRVTGVNPSNILGKLGVLGNANLFLINPNGIIFGPNASLDIGGSFVGSTANSLNFADSTQFSATAHPTTPLLTVSVPIGLQFGGAAGSIRNQSRATNSSGEVVGLQMQPGKTLALVGGNVSLDGGILQALGGRVELGGVSGAGTLGLNVDGNNLIWSFPSSVGRADVSFTNGADVNVRAGGGGSIAINAQNIDILGGSRLRAGIASGLGSVDSFAGDIEINATGVIKLTDDSLIANWVSEEAVGKGGNINITTGSLFVTNGAVVGARTRGQGDAGSVNIHAARTVSLDGVGSNGSSSGAFSAVASEAVGKAGGINITTGSLYVMNGAALSASTYGQGYAGSISVQANGSVSFAVDGGIFSNTYGPGKGGEIHIQARSVSVTDGAELQAITLGSGNAGNIQVDALDSVTLSGVSVGGYSSGLFTITNDDASGQGGDITVQTGALRILDGAVLSARTKSNGDGGNITVNVNTLEIMGGGQMLTTAYSSGDAGSITVNAVDNITLSGSDPTYFERLAEFGGFTVDPASPASGLFANTVEGSRGQGGSLKIEARRLNVQNGAEVNVSSAGAGAAGNLAVSAGSIGLDNQSSIRATTRASDQGNITLRSPTLVLRRESQITTNATGTATGGNITLNTDVLAALENSDISANAVEGRGGNVQINSQGLFLSPDSQITASSERGVEGVVEINTPDVDPIRGLVTLPAELVDASGLIASGCADGVENEFIITGRGGLPPNPSDTLSSDTVWTDLRYRTKLALTRPISEEASQPTNPMAGQLVEAQGWVINNLGLVVLTATAPAVTRPIPWMPSAECHTP